MLPDSIHIVEVGPRDGLQNEAKPVSTPTKLEFIKKLTEARLTSIEATSFVHPQIVPQLADADEVVRSLPPNPGVTYSALVPNERGLDRALAAGVRRIAVFTAASQTFTQKNIGMNIEQSLELFRRIFPRARQAGMSVRGYISTCFVCPFEGNITRERVCEVAAELVGIGVDEVSISDTIGAAVPTDVKATVSRVLDIIPPEKVALHFHDTYGTALANVYAGMQLGVTTFDASAGGLGGCPFAPGAAGNLATEDLVYMMDRMGVRTGVNIEKLLDAAAVIAAALGRELPSAQWQRLRRSSTNSTGHDRAG